MKWKPVVGFEKSYEVSESGIVRSKQRVITRKDGRAKTIPERNLSPCPVGKGKHLQVQLWDKNQAERRLVHRIVLESFIGTCPPGNEACHGNGDVTDNRLQNLRWDTRSANQHDAIQHGTHYNASKTSCKNGHEYTAENTKKIIDKRGNRRLCIQCNRDYQREWARTKKRGGA